MSATASASACVLTVLFSRAAARARGREGARVCAPVRDVRHAAEIKSPHKPFHRAHFAQRSDSSVAYVDYTNPTAPRHVQPATRRVDLRTGERVVAATAAAAIVAAVEHCARRGHGAVAGPIIARSREHTDAAVPAEHPAPFLSRPQQPRSCHPEAAVRAIPVDRADAAVSALFSVAAAAATSTIASDDATPASRALSNSGGSWRCCRTAELLAAVAAPSADPLTIAAAAAIATAAAIAAIARIDPACTSCVALATQSSAIELRTERRWCCMPHEGSAPCLFHVSGANGGNGALEVSSTERRRGAGALSAAPVAASAAGRVPVLDAFAACNGTHIAGS